MALERKDFDTLMRLEPLDRIQRASMMMDEARNTVGRLANIRGQALLELHVQGLSAIELAAELGISRQQVHRLMKEAYGKDGPPQRLPRRG